jgi:hypothetical protein
MTSITFPQTNSHQKAGNVTAALHDLAAASQQLISALWATLTQRGALAPTVRKAHKEAEKLRAMADELARSDPHFAQDLYAAADRHELGANAG